jgi:hypothetical protein
MMAVPARPPTIAPTRTPAPPTIIIALFSGVDPDSIRRTAAGCGASTRAADVAFVHDGVGAADGTRSMTTADATTEDDPAGATSTVVSGLVGLVCAVSGAAMSNTAIAVVTLRRCDM